MIYTFSEIRNEVYRAIGVNSANAPSALTGSVNLRINQIQDYIYFHKPWQWRQRSHWLTTRDVY